MTRFGLFNLILTGLILFALGCVPGAGELAVEDLIPAVPEPKITSVSVVNQELIIVGSDLDSVTGVRISDGTTDFNFNILTKVAGQVTAAGVAAFNFTASATYNLLISSAFGQQTFPITLSPAAGGIDLTHLGDVGANDGDVIKWDNTAQQWYTAPDSGAGVGGTGTVTSVSSGTGLTGGPITVSGVLAVDVGTTANKIPQFDGSAILPLGPELRMTQTSNTVSIYTDGSSGIFFKDVTGTTELGNFNSTGDLTLTGDLVVGGTVATVNGKNICLQDGTDCPAGTNGTVTNVATGSGLTGGPITTTGTISVDTGGITNAHLADNSVTSAKIQDGTVSSADIADGAVSSADILDSTIASADIADGTISATDLSSMGATSGQGLVFNGSNWAPQNLSGTVTSVATGTGLTGGPITTSGTISVAAGGISATELGTNAVTNAKLASDAVTSAKIQDSTIVSADIADGTIVSADIGSMGATSGQILTYNGSAWAPETVSGTGTVTSVATGTGLTGGPITTTGTVSIAAGGVSATELANDAVEEAKIAANAVTSAKIQDGTVSSADIANGTITSTDISDDTVSSADITDGTIATADLSAMGASSGQVLSYNGSAWTATTPTAGTVTSVATGTGLTGGPITATGTVSIAAGGVSATELANDAVEEAKIAANAVTSAKIQDSTIVSADISDGTIVSADISDGTVSSADIADSTIVSADISDGTVASVDITDGTIAVADLSAMGATTGQRLRYNGSAWEPDDCPAGFTEISAAGNVLGCMQTAEEGTATWYVATDDCFTTYGGRLPEPLEWYISMNNYTLTAETGNWEWTSEIKDSNQIIRYGNADLTTINQAAAPTASSAYRCWIPR